MYWLEFGRLVGSGGEDSRGAVVGGPVLGLGVDSTRAVNGLR